MQSLSDIERGELQRERAMGWIAGLMEKLANDLGVRNASWTWQISSTDDARTYQLVVCGSRDRRTVKLFTSDELDRCLDDEDLQSVVQARLARLVAFLADNPARKKSGSHRVK